jgi:predicted phosphoadenosine phosphosulfate sulfurtransferase
MGEMNVLYRDLPVDLQEVIIKRIEELLVWHERNAGKTSSSSFHFQNDLENLIYG